MIAADKLAKLPIWAQDEIARLKANLETREKQITTVLGGAPSKVRIANFPLLDQDQFLPDPSRIKFDVGTNVITVYIDQEGDLNIFGHDGFVIQPWGSNSIKVPK